MSFDSPEKVTFVGVGAIGLPMAIQLHQAGFSVTAVDPFEGSRQRANDAGIPAEAVPESAGSADIVIAMVATPDQLDAAAIAEDGLLDRMSAGSTLVIMSTVGPESVSRVGAAAAQRGIRVLDVPVTGGVAGAKRGTLTLFCSGEKSIAADAASVLSVFGKVIDAGEEIGNGQSFKAVNQLLCSVHLAAAGEALAFAEALGLDPTKVFEAVSGGAGGSWMLSDRGPRMLEGLDADVTSAISIFVKDSGLVAQIADANGFEAPLANAARSRFEQASAAGLTRKDDSQVIQTYRAGSES